jgi:hypothetical protein
MASADWIWRGANLLALMRGWLLVRSSGKLGGRLAAGGRGRAGERSVNNTALTAINQETLRLCFGYSANMPASDA